jgi:hypothetical protein
MHHPLQARVWLRDRAFQHEIEAYVQHANRVLGALKIAANPVQAVCYS